MYTKEIVGVRMWRADGHDSLQTVILGQRERDVHVACGFENVLLAIHFVADGIGAGGMAELDVPQRLAVFGVESEEVAFVGTAEYQAAGGGKHGDPGGREKFELPLQLRGSSFERANRAIGLLAEKRANSAAAYNPFRWSWFDFSGAFDVVGARFMDTHVEKSRLRAVRGAGPVNASRDAGVNQGSRAESWLLIRRGNWAAIGIESLCPSFLHKRNAGDEFSRGTIEHVVKTIAIGEADQFSRLAVDIGIE